MIIYRKNEGYFYEDDNTGKHYSLHEMKSLGANTTSDIIAIFGDKDEGMVGWFYGATELMNDPKRLDEIVPQYIKGDQAHHIHYSYSEKGIRAFLNDSLNDIFERLDNGQDMSEFDFRISCGSRNITLLCMAHTVEAMEDFIKEVIEGEDF